jgi:hypothetical protein
MMVVNSRCSALSVDSLYYVWLHQFCLYVTSCIMVLHASCVLGSVVYMLLIFFCEFVMPFIVVIVVRLALQLYICLCITSLLGGGTNATRRKVSGSIPDVIGFFNWPNPSSRTRPLGSTQPLTAMSTRNLPGGKGRPVHKADKFIVICESTVQKMWEPRRLTTLWASTACYKDSFTFLERQYQFDVQVIREGTQKTWRTDTQINIVSAFLIYRLPTL